MRLQVSRSIVQTQAWLFWPGVNWVLVVRAVVEPQSCHAGGRLEKWARRSFVMFDKGKHQALHHGRNSPKHQYLRGLVCWKADPQGPRMLMDTGMNMSILPVQHW